MSTRNFPPSFWNSQHPGDVYEYATDPWHPHYPQYHHRFVILRIEEKFLDPMNIFYLFI